MKSISGAGLGLASAVLIFFHAGLIPAGAQHGLVMELNKSSAILPHAVLPQG